MLKKLIAVFLIIGVFASSGFARKDILVELLDEHGEAIAITVGR